MVKRCQLSLSRPSPLTQNPLLNLDPRRDLGLGTGFLVILLWYHLAPGVLGNSRFYFRLWACKIRSQFPLCINMVGPSSSRLRICYLICNPTAIANIIFSQSTF